MRKLADEALECKMLKHIDLDYILLPRVFSKNRKYILIGFVSKDIIGNYSISIVLNAIIYDFGILIKCSYSVDKSCCR